MTVEEYTPSHPAEQAGVLVGRAYTAAVSALVAPVRKSATPTWHWRLAYRAGSAVREMAERGVDGVERRIRTAPKRLVDGLKRLFRAAVGAGVRQLGARVGGVAFGGWWAWSWATSSGISPRLALWAAAGVGLVVVYAAGSEPAKRPVTRRERARQLRAVRALLRALDRMLAEAPGLHLADLAQQITARSQALGRPVTHTAASLRALLEPLGVPIRPQIDLGGVNRPGIHAGDWRAWIAHHQTQARPSRGGGEEAPTREEPLPSRGSGPEAPLLEAADPQVAAGDLEISGRDLGQDEPSGEGLRAPYTSAQLRLLEHVRTAIGTARGTHLRDILTTAQTAGDATNWSVTRLRRELETLGITVEEKLWLNGGNTRGVLATSLPTTDEETL